MNKFCKKCLLSEIDKDEYLKNIFEYIDSIPIDKKCTNEVYQHRLSVCKHCNSLINGMCEICGCFVEVRAIKKDMYCPLGEYKW